MGMIKRNVVSNFLSKLKGYSWCYYCGYTWEIVEGAYIPYKERLPEQNGGMFPICSECFDKLGEDEICKYCGDLMGSWIAEHVKSSVGVKDDDCIKKDLIKLTENYNLYLDNIKYNVRYMKEKGMNSMW